MLRKRDVSDIEGSDSPRTGAGVSEGRMSATPIGTGSGGRTSVGTERPLGSATIVPTRTAPFKERATEVGEAVGEGAGAVRDRVVEGARRAGSAVREAARQVDIEEFNLKGNVGGYPFHVELENQGQAKFLAFEVNLETDTGDMVRISGRKRIGEGETLSGEIGGRRLGRGEDEDAGVLGEIETRPAGP